MQPSSCTPNITMLHILQQKQQEIITEVEHLESKLNYITNKPTLSTTLCSTLSKCSQLLKDLSKSSVFPTNTTKKLTDISETLQSQVSLITKHLNFSLESAAIPKLIQLFKLQVSINSFTRDFYEAKLNALTSPKSLESTSKSEKQKTAELAHSLSLIQVQNKHFTAAINKNITQLSLLIEPAIEKTLNSFTILKQTPSYQFSPEFEREKSEIEEHFKGVSNYLHQFSELFAEFCTARQDFDTFSEIANNENSVHRLELEDLEANHQFSYDKRVSKEFIDDLRIIDEIVKVADTDAECQKLCLRNLLRIMESLEAENKQWDVLSKSAQKINQHEQIKFLFKLINEFFQLLRESITNKDASISALEDIRENAAEHLRRVRKQESSLFNVSKRSYIFVDSAKLSSSGKCKEEKLQAKGDEVSPFNCAQEFSDSSESARSFRIEKDSLENAEKLANDLRAAQTQIRSFQETIAELMLKNENLQRLLRDIDSKQMTGPIFEFFQKVLQLSDQFSKLKMQTVNELKEFSIFVQKKFTENASKVKICVQGLNLKIEELKDLNECLAYEKDVLKDTFQNEVKKLIFELQEVKKMNKDLKDSLLKLSNKYESQNKLSSELLAGLGLAINEPIPTIKQSLAAQHKFITKLQTAFGIKDLKALATALLHQKPETKSPKQEISKVLSTVFQTFDRNTGKLSLAFKTFFDKYHLKVEKCQQLLDIFKKVYENDMAGCLQEIEAQSIRVQDYNIRIEELERSNIKYKHLERELQCVISTKSLELQESKENFNTLQEFTENCIRVIEEFKNLSGGKAEFKELEPAIDEILALYKDLL